MLEVGYLSLSSPVAVVLPWHGLKSGFGGLFLLESFDLDRTSLEEIEEALRDQRGGLGDSRDTGKDKAAPLGFSIRSSEDDGPIMDAARMAGKNLYLLEIDFSDEDDPERMKDLVSKIKSCGTTLSIRVKPEILQDGMVAELGRAGLDIIHLDLIGMNGVGPKIVKKAADAIGPKIMAMGDVGDFEDAKALLAMGADMISLQSPEPGVAKRLSDQVGKYDDQSGWYNCPKHICSGGDLRGLAFCCPPVKHCPVLGALKKAGFTPESFVQKKLAFAKGTPLEKGDGTCFGSLVWCCKITKPCYLRDTALRRYGISGKEYMRLKKDLAENLLRP
jgi:putative methanogenesis marker domain 9